MTIYELAALSVAIISIIIALTAKHIIDVRQVKAKYKVKDLETLEERNKTLLEVIGLQSMVIKAYANEYGILPEEKWQKYAKEILEMNEEEE